MASKGERESSSFKWIHRVREAHYRETKGLPLEAWLKPVDLENAARACRRLGLEGRVAPRKRQKAHLRA